MTPETLQRAWDGGRIIPLAAPQEVSGLQQALGGGAAETRLAKLAQRFGAGVIVGSGGSQGGRRWCLQPLAHLQASAAATGAWLRALGLDPAQCLQLNPLPLHHVSGLMPVVRAQQWGARYRLLAAALMRDPGALPAVEGPALLSLVPTQLSRLLDHPAGVAWLQQLAVIWLGGAPLPPALAARARRLGLRLAPCYGATETAAMVCALPPERFLAGDEGSGPPLVDAHLHIDPQSGALEIASDRLSPGWLEAGQLVALPLTAEGRWRSGDAARLTPAGVQILGRLDGAIHSGGETVFPEQVEQRLLLLGAQAGLPLGELVLLAQADAEWGQRLVALVRPQGGVLASALIDALAELSAQLPPCQRPLRWLLCPELRRNSFGKWERQRWQDWLQAHDSAPA